jgi:hypothetical protein
MNGASLELDVPTTDAFIAKIRAVAGVDAAKGRSSFGAMINAHDTTALASSLPSIPSRANAFVRAASRDFTVRRRPSPADEHQEAPPTSPAVVSDDGQ